MKKIALFMLPLFLILGGIVSSLEAFTDLDTRISLSRDDSKIQLAEQLQNDLQNNTRATLLTQNFDGTTFPPTGWTNRNVDGGGSQWARSTNYPYGGSVASAYHIWGSGMQNGWLITPRIAIPTGVNVTLSFKTVTLYPGDYYSHTVMIIASDANTPPAVTDPGWTQIWEEPNPLQSWADGTVLIPSSYVGQNIYLAFVYKGDFADGWIIDNVELNAVSAIEHNLTIGVNPPGSGTTIPPAGVNSIPENTVVNLTATPGFGYTWDKWTGPVANTATHRTTITMDANKSIAAGFTSYGLGNLFVQDVIGGNAFASQKYGTTDWERAEYFVVPTQPIEKLVFHALAITSGAEWTPSDTEHFTVRFYEEGPNDEPNWSSPVYNQTFQGKVFSIGPVWSGQYNGYKVELDLPNNSNLNLSSGWVSVQCNLDAGSGGVMYLLSSEAGTGDGFHYFRNGTTASEIDGDIYLEIWGTADPILSVSEQGWDYGLAFANNSSCTPRSFTATNTGGGYITIPYGNVRLEGRDAAHFTLTDNNTYPITLGAGQSASWSVKFNPTCEGEKIAQLVIEDSNGAKYTVAEVTPETGSQVELVKAGAFGPVQPRERSLDLTPISFEKQKPDPENRKVTEPGINMQARQQITMPNSQDEKSHNPITMGQIIPADFSAKDSKSISLRGFGVDPVYEDYFEDYGHISHNLSPWTQYDGDGDITYLIEAGAGNTIIPSYTGSYIGLKYSGYQINAPILMAYSDDGYVGCMQSENVPNDDWLISQKLIFGRNPRISFFAKSLVLDPDQYPSSFNVLYSTTGNSQTDFTNSLNATPQYVGSDWTVFEYRLPSECVDAEVYVAIQCVSSNSVMLMVDDFVAGSSSCSMYAVQNGYWSNPDTWSTGTVPNSLDDVCIPDGMTVIVDSEYVSYQDNWSGAYSYTSQANAGSVTVADGGSLIIDSRAVLDVFGDLDNSGVITWNAGTASGGDYTTTLFVLGDLYNHETGTLNGAADHTNLYFNGDQAQTFTNDGSITGLIYNIGLENGYGLTLAGDNPIPARRINLFTGQLSNSSLLVLGSSNGAAYVQVGNLEQNNLAGSFDEHPGYVENTVILIYYASGNSDYSTGYEIPEDGIIDYMVVYMDSGTPYSLTMSSHIIISGRLDDDEWNDEVIFIGGRLYFDGYALIYNAEDFYISGGEGVYVDDFQVEIDTQTQYSIPGTVATYLHTWETYGTQDGGVEMNFYNPTEWGSAMYVDAYVSDDGGQTWTLYESNVPVTNSIATLDGVTDLGAPTQTRIWAFANPSVPVELSSFTAAISADNFVNLMWVTQTETGVLGYYVPRGTENLLADAITVSELIPATNTSEQQSYIFKDSELFEDGYYYYWLQNSDMDGTVSFHGPVGIQFSTIGSGVPEIPLVTELKPVYPNPFNPMAYIPFSLKEAANVNFEIYNARGQLVKRIPLGQKSPGHYRTEWDGRDDQGRACGTGVYHIRMTAGNDSYLRKAVLMK